MTKLIGGYGGGGGKGGGGSSARTAQESPDNLRSRSYARVVDLISEGEIQGFATGDLRSMYLDGTPIMNEDGTFNFTGITVASRNGTQTQTYIPGFPSAESEKSVNLRVQQATPVVRTVSDSGVTHVRVTIGIPQLTEQNTTNGDITGTSVRYAIDVQPNGGSYTERVNDIISGKTTTRYQRSHLVQLTGSAPWNIRVRRITADSASVAMQNQSFWDSYTEIVDGKLRYPNSAIVASVIDSQQFSSIPTRGFDMKLLRIRIPSNAAVRDDGSLTYSGSWDGNFQIAWSSNPAWCFYDMLTNDRYGLGVFIDESQIDKWALYTIGRYCDELVPDGFGGTEPRFTCNLYIQQRAEAFKVLQDMAAIFRGLSYWASGLITAVQDAPSDPVAIFSNSNVLEGVFSYSGTSQKTRHSVALVSWNDPADLYKRKIEYVEDAVAVARYGIVETNIVAPGCTSRGQAHRVGKWLLYSESRETETVSFKAGLDSVLARPGQIIIVQDAHRAGLRLGGRVAAATTTQITVDSGFTASPGRSYTFYATLPDGSIASSVVSSVAGNIINLSTPLPAVPLVGAVWAVKSNTISTQTFRVLAVSEEQDGGYEITALAHDPNKFAYVENGIQLAETPVSILNQPPDAPEGLQVVESLYETNTEIKVLVTASWNAVARAASYTVSYKRDDGNLITTTGIGAALFEIRDAQPGSYTFYVYAVSDIGKRSVASVITKQILGKTAPPADVHDFSIAGISSGVANLTWTQSADLDVVVGGYIRIRHSPDIMSATWSAAVDIGPALPGSATSASVPHINGTYLAKFVDSSGNSSVNAVGITTSTANIINLNVVQTITENPAWSGTKNNTAFDAFFGGLTLGSGVLFDSLPGLIDDYGLWDYAGGIANSGTYDFQATDLGAVYTCQITAAIAAQSFDLGSLFDSLPGLIDDYGLWDGDPIDDVNAALYVSTTNDDPAGSPVWSSYRPFFVGQYTARAFRFRLLLTSDFAEHSIAVTGLTVTVDMPDRVEAQAGLNSGAGAFNVVFPVAFWDTPAIGITARNIQTGDYYTVTSQSATGFTITFFNSAGTAVSRSFDYLAKGRGRRT